MKTSSRIAATLVSSMVIALFAGGIAVARQIDETRSLDPATENNLDDLLRDIGQEDDGPENITDLNGFSDSLTNQLSERDLFSEDGADVTEMQERLVPMFVPGLISDVVENGSDVVADEEITPEGTVTQTKGELIAQPFVRLRGLDKISGETTDLAVPIGGDMLFGGLRVTVRACHQTPPTEPPESISYLEIEDYGFKATQAELDGTKIDPERRVFHGWMYASSPGIHALEHPIYDIWVIRCMTEAPDLSPAGNSDQASKSP